MKDNEFDFTKLFMPMKNCVEFMGSTKDWDFSKVPSMKGCTKFEGSLKDWDLSKIN